MEFLLEFQWYLTGIEKRILKSAWNLKILEISGAGITKKKCSKKVKIKKSKTTKLPYSLNPQ